MPVPRRYIWTEEWVNKHDGSHRESQTSKYIRQLPVWSVLVHRNPDERGLEIPVVAQHRVVPLGGEWLVQPPVSFSLPRAAAGSRPIIIGM